MSTRSPQGCKMLLTEILSEKRIKAPLLATTKQEAIAELVD